MGQVQVCRLDQLALGADAFNEHDQLELEEDRRVGAGATAFSVTHDGNLNVATAVNAQIVTIPGVDLWPDGSVYFVNKTVRLYGEAGAIKTPNNLAVGGGLTVAGAPIQPWVSLTQAAYDALPTKSPTTLYVIVP